MPNFYSLINALGSMNVGLMQICMPLSPSLEIFCPVMTKIKYMYTTTRACTLIVNVTVIIEPFHQYSRNGNLSTLILIPTLPKPTAYFSVISSWRLLNQEKAHTRVCDMGNFYAMLMYLFFFTGSEHDETIWAGAYHKYDQRRLRRACAFVQSCQGHAAH